MGFGGREFARRTAANPSFIQALSAASRRRIIPVPGGVLIRDEAGEIIGAVGIKRRHFRERRDLSRLFTASNAPGSRPIPGRAILSPNFALFRAQVIDIV
jgi:hypothetical protein